MSDHYTVSENLSERRHRPGPPPEAGTAKRGGRAAREKYVRPYRARGEQGETPDQGKRGRARDARSARRGSTKANTKGSTKASSGTD
jgi:hypothetical protein